MLRWSSHSGEYSCIHVARDHVYPAVSHQALCVFPRTATEAIRTRHETQGHITPLIRKSHRNLITECVGHEESSRIDTVMEAVHRTIPVENRLIPGVVTED